MQTYITIYGQQKDDFYYTDIILTWFSIFFITLLITGICLFFILKIIQQRRVIYNIRKFAADDPVWNGEKMLLHARTLFFEINHAWMNLDFSPVLPWVTDEIKLEWVQVLQHMEKHDLLFNFSSVQVDSIKIVGAKDDLGTTGDEYSVQVEGYMRRYFRSRITNMLVKGNSAGFDYFSDLYTFERRDDDWFLKKIDYEAGFGKIIRTQMKK